MAKIIYPDTEKLVRYKNWIKNGKIRKFER